MNEFLNRPGRPQHPDMMVLIDLMVQLDGQATEGGRDAGDIAGEVVDAESLSYLAIMRVQRAQQLTNHKVDMRTEITMAALYLEAFVMGARFTERRARKN